MSDVPFELEQFFLRNARYRRTPDAKSRRTGSAAANWFFAGVIAVQPDRDTPGSYEFHQEARNGFMPMGSATKVEIMAGPLFKVAWTNHAVFGAPRIENEIVLDAQEHAALLVWLDQREEAGFAEADFGGFSPEPTPTFTVTGEDVSYTPRYGVETPYGDEQIWATGVTVIGGLAQIVYDVRQREFMLFGETPEIEIEYAGERVWSERTQLRQVALADLMRTGTTRLNGDGVAENVYDVRLSEAALDGLRVWLDLLQQDGVI